MTKVMKAILRFNLLTALIAVFLTPGFLHAQNDAEKFVNSGIESEKNGNDQEAVFYYSLAIQADPSYADAFYHRGIVYYKMKNVTGALGDFNKAIQLDPNHAESYFKRGI